MDNYTESERAFISVLESDTDTYEAKRSAAATVMAVDALSLLVSLVDELIVLGATTDMESRRAVVANDVHGNNNPIVVQAAGLGQISAYSELFEWYRSFLRSNLNTTYVRTGRATRDPLREMRGAFESSSDYLSGRALLQTPECSSLFCSLYTLRLENPDISINEFTFTQILRNEVYEAFSGDNPGRDREKGYKITFLEMKLIDISIHSDKVGQRPKLFFLVMIPMLDNNNNNNSKYLKNVEWRRACPSVKLITS